MPTRKQIRPDEKLPLKLTAAEQKLVLEGLTAAAKPKLPGAKKNAPSDVAGDRSRAAATPKYRQHRASF